jgi:Glycosyl transferase family 2
MRLIAMLPCRNEDWILNLSARAALMWCDAIVILDHASTDATWSILGDLDWQFKDRLFWTKEKDPMWREMDHRQYMLAIARDLNATHLAIIDSDEILSGNLLGSIRTHIESMPRGWILQLPGYNLRGSLDRYHANGIWGQRWFSTAFKDDACLGWSGDRFHQREPSGGIVRQSRPIMQGQGGIMHLWGASERRLRAKHALYKMTETLRWPAKSRAEINTLYNLAFIPSANREFDQNWRYAEVPTEWWEPYSDLRSSVKLGSIPWQEEMCRTLHMEHGAERFAGLDLFGVVATEVNAGVR